MSCNGRDNGTGRPPWTLVDNGDGTHKVRNVHTGKLLGSCTAPPRRGRRPSGPDNGSADNRWRVVPTGARRLQNKNSGLVLGVTGMSTADGALVVQWVDTGTADHLWTATLGSDGLLKVRNQHTGKLLAVDGTGNGGRAISTTDTGATTQKWRLRYTSGGYFRLQSATGRVLGVDSMSTTQGAQALGGTTAAPPTTCGGSSEARRGGRGATSAVMVVCSESAMMGHGCRPGRLPALRAPAQRARHRRAPVGGAAANLAESSARCCCRTGTGW